VTPKANSLITVLFWYITQLLNHANYRQRQSSLCDTTECIATKCDRGRQQSSKLSTNWVLTCNITAQCLCSLYYSTLPSPFLQVYGFNEFKLLHQFTGCWAISWIYSYAPYYYVPYCIPFGTKVRWPIRGSTPIQI
jgi:hypothetical protein